MLSGGYFRISKCYNVLRKPHTYLLYMHFSNRLPGRLTYDSAGFDGLHDLLQGLQVRVLVSKLLLLVVQMASSLRLCDMSFIQNSAWCRLVI